MQFNTTSDIAAQAFITRWRGSAASELSTAQSFVSELCALGGVDKPHATTGIQKTQSSRPRQGL